MPLLHLKDNEDRCQKLARVLAEAYLASNGERVAFLQQYLLGYIGIGEVVFYGGQLAAALPEPESPIHVYQDQSEYQHGLVSADKLDLFLDVNSSGTSSADFCRTAGKYCSKAFMDHFGYSSNNIYFYFGGAFTAQNQETIRHLFAKVEDKDHLYGRIRDFIFLCATNDNMVTFARWLLREGYLVLDAKHWESLRSYSTLYNGLQADV